MGRRRRRRWPGWRRRARPASRCCRWTADTRRCPSPATWWSRPSAATRRAAFVARMAAAHEPPLWINLEYLSAEAYVRAQPRPALAAAAAARARPDQVVLLPRLHARHRRPAARAGPDGRAAALRPPRLAARRAAWRRGPASGVVSLFCYDNAPVAALLAARWPRAPTLLLVDAGAPRAGAAGCAGAPAAAGTLRCIALPWLTQPDYDRLLWACDLNFVRGEDSFVRAHVGRRALRLADLPAARRRARRQAATPFSA